MSGYLVRLTDTKDLVGIFWADRLSDLFWLVDECTDPYGCEYTRVKPGGIYWGTYAVAVPIPVDDDGEPLAGDDGWRTRWEPSDDVWAALHDGKRKWHPVPGLENGYAGK